MPLVSRAPDVPADAYRIVTPDRFWRFWKLLLGRPFTWLFRMRVYGAEHVPRSGPVVIASNHIAGIDVVVLGRASPRTLRYMAKAELFTYNRILAWMLRHAGAFGVRRGESDLEALRLARRVLQAGHALGVFAEGTRQPSEAIGTVQPGASLIALSEGAPIVPVVIQGTIFSKQSLRHPVTVMFGPPLAVAQTAQRGKAYREAVISTTHELQRELERLQRRTQAAIAAGRPRDLAGVDAGGDR
jgi:1-acyl-sn-glycerol-3-phosphate acyltransferase